MRCPQKCGEQYIAMVLTHKEKEQPSMHMSMLFIPAYRGKKITKSYVLSSFLFTIFHQMKQDNNV